MAKPFSKVDAKDLIASHISLIRGLDVVQKRCDGLRERVRREAEGVLKSQVLSMEITDCLQNGPQSGNPPPAVHALTRLLQCFEAAGSAARRAEALDREQRGRIAAEIRQLKPGTQTIRWLFSGRKTRAEAEQAYHDLARLLDGPYKQTILDCYDAMRQSTAQADAPDPAVPVGRPEAYQRVLEDCAGPQWNAIRRIPRLESVLTEAESAQNSCRKRNHFKHDRRGGR